MTMQFEHLAKLPLKPGERVTAMTMWKPHGVEMLILATSLNRLFALRVSDRVEITGPIETVDAAGWVNL
jgi:hypothetical protein